MIYQEINQCKSIENLPNEIFKDIPGYEGLYQVSNLGRVKILCKKAGRSNRKEKILKFYKNIYLMCNLSKNSISKRFRIHYLVLLSFIGERPKGYQINHIDGNKENNKLDNLEYCTCKENINHAINIGLRKHIKYKKGYKGNCTKKKKIRQYDLQGNFIAEYESIREAEKITKISCSDISRCARKIKHYNKTKNFIWNFTNE